MSQTYEQTKQKAIEILNHANGNLIDGSSNRWTILGTPNKQGKFPEHTITLINGVLSCSCMSYKMNVLKRKLNYCKHTEVIRIREGIK